jgi:hypothetical protein
LTQYTKTGENIPNNQKIPQSPYKRQKFQLVIKYQPFPFQGPPKCTQIGILGLKFYYLATLPRNVSFCSLAFLGWDSFN